MACLLGLKRFGLIAVAALAIAMFSTATFAQQRGGGQAGGQAGGQGGGQGRGMGDGSRLIDAYKSITDKLTGITDDQKTKLDPIYTQARDDFKQASQEAAGPERREKMMSMRSDLQDKIKAVLTDDQKKEFDEKIAAMRGGRGGGQAGAAGAGGGQGRGGAMQQMRKFQDAVRSLDLTDDQKPKVEDAMKSTAEKLRQLQQDSQGDQQSMREKARPIIDDLGVQLRAILTPEQQQKLRDAMQADNGAGAGDGNRPPSTQPATPPTTEPGSMLPPGQSKLGESQVAETQPGAPPGLAERLEVGQPAPDFRITKLDGLPVQLSSFKGKILLLSFGSFTSPSFRQRAAALDELRQDYSSRISTLIVYTREAHPAGGWEVDRNKDAQINIPDHKNLAARIDVAREARARLQLAQFPFATDSIDNATATAYQAFPNDAAVLIGKDGEVLAYQKWFEPAAMRAAIVDATGRK